MRMRALSVHQPWAGFLALGLKKVETRDWRHIPRKIIGERLAIQATRLYETAAYSCLEAASSVLFDFGTDVGPYDARLTPCAVFGAVLCHGKVVRCELGLPDDDHLALCEATGNVIIELADLVRLDPPIPCKGHQGFFWVEIPDPVRSVRSVRSVGSDGSV